MTRGTVLVNEKKASFEKDLGYLDRFFDNLQAHAAEALGEEKGAALSQFIDEERGRWADIRAMIQGEGTSAPSQSAAPAPSVEEGDARSSEGSPGPEAPAASDSPAAPSAPQPAAPRRRAGKPGLTVGSLYKSS